MKISRLILILAVIRYCLTDEESIDCQIEYGKKIIQKNEDQCLIIGSCSYNNTYKTCKENHDCSEGNNKAQDVCEEIVPTNFYSHKCKKDGNNCVSTRRLCPNDWKKLAHTYVGNSETFDDDICSELTPPTGEGDRCVEYSGQCKPHFDVCTSITNSMNNPSQTCGNNIPKDPIYKCDWKSETTSCQPKERYCDEFYQAGKDICKALLLKDSVFEKEKKKCVYKNNGCVIEYETCESITLNPGENCENFMPLNTHKDDYDYTKRCIDNKDIENKCIFVNRKCEEYALNTNIEIPSNLINDSLCGSLSVTANYYRCAYDKSRNICYQEYNRCEDYISNKVETDRERCEKIQLLNQNEKCYYDMKTDECITKPKFEKCSDYEGKDKKTCESIFVSESNLPFCILDKDSTCKERPLLCSEVFSSEDCLKIAKASDENKRCAWNGTCYEEYIRCEDFLEDSSSTCPSIRLYDGKNCKFENNRCRSINKICIQAETEEECKLIAETGVKDTERKVCSWINDAIKCKETYKYCSDYRKICESSDNTCQTICEEQIKPYDETGNNLDIGFKCYYEDDVGCQKVKVECENAGTNPILCESYNDYIYDKNKKYCGFFEGNCKTYYKICEDVEFDNTDSNSRLKCTDNVIQEDSIFRGCEIKDGKCVQKSSCDKFTSITSFTTIISTPTPSPTTPTQPDTFLKDLCESIHHKCTYKNALECISEEKTCEEIKFYKMIENNTQICESMLASKPYKKCILKEDKSGCKEVYRDLSYSTYSNSYLEPPEGNTQESSEFIKKTTNLIILLLVLL